MVECLLNSVLAYQLHVQSDPVEPCYICLAIDGEEGKSAILELPQLEQQEAYIIRRIVDTLNNEITHDCVYGYDRGGLLYQGRAGR